jgi:hypothetical protein
MTLDQTIRKEASFLFKMSSIQMEIESLKVKISQLEPLLKEERENGNQDDYEEYQSEIVEHEIRIDLLTQAYNEMLKIHKKNTLNLKPIEA